MNPYEMKAKFLETLQRLFGQAGNSPRRQKHSMIKSNAPKVKKVRPAHSPKPRKPSPRNRAILIARQKKGR